MKFEYGADSEDSKNYVKLKDGESIRGVFRGELLGFKKHWAGNRTELCVGAPNCKFCLAEPSKKPSFRFRVNLIVKEGEGYVAKIFEQGWKVYLQLKDINAEVPLETILVKISRTGSGVSDTSYTIIPVPNGTLTQEQADKIGAVPLIDLRVAENKPEGHGQQHAESVPPFDPETDVPF